MAFVRSAIQAAARCPASASASDSARSLLQTLYPGFSRRSWNGIEGRCFGLANARCSPVSKLKNARRMLHSSMRPDYESLHVNGPRLMANIHDTSRFGMGQRWGNDSTETGMSRLSLSASDKEARDWFVQTTKALGCQVTVDSMGNIFAVRPGRMDGPPTCAGSHLDTQPSGGRYDGVLGVLSGVEILKTLQENKVETAYPVGVVNWTNEEGARFPVSMMGSGVWAGAISVQKAYDLKDVQDNSKTVKSELERIGYLGQLPASYKSMPLGAHFELHIEQGPVLGSANQHIGVVIGGQAYKWFTIGIQGRDAHTGTTPLANRADALLLASKMILHSHRIATKYNALASTGILRLLPGSTNTIPGSVHFSLDIRAPADETVLAVESDLKRDFDRLKAGEDVGGLQAGCTESGVPFSLSWTTDSETHATAFHPDCIDCVRVAATDSLQNVKIVGGERSQGRDVRELISGAGHDSVYTSRQCPTAMIFIPCREGISHHPEEYAAPEDCALGAQVLLKAILRYDAMRAERGH